MSNLKVLFGKRVKKFRTKKKLSQEELAERIGIAVTNMGKIEHGESFVTAPTLEKLADVLDIEVKYLFDFEDYKSIDDIKNELHIDLQSDANVHLLYRLYKMLINE
ncbi:helix-turn-helix transcriptional regulator [Spirochaetes bacterium]|uniref:Helix-turn-helix transcriptional regulator n=1 Tax=Candidatus Scatousia excrementipullorum TaxID=2840936 RepID=A0A9D9DM17_9BACT|nr:helix-turn-helix transcriptional regulator [Candidatus Scatousia excrementipullorum]